MDAHEHLKHAAHAAREATQILARSSRPARDAALRAMADALRASMHEILAANERDCHAAQPAVASGSMSAATFARLRIDRVDRNAVLTPTVDGFSGRVRTCRTIGLIHEFTVGVDVNGPRVIPTPGSTARGQAPASIDDFPCVQRRSRGWRAFARHDAV